MRKGGELRAAWNRSITRLTLAGWGLVLVSAAAIVLVAIVVGAWALETISHRQIGHYVVICLLAFPCALAGLATWLVGARALRSAGVRVWRARRKGA